MTDDRESLRRIAFGPGATARERTAAEESLRQLGEEQLAVEVKDPHRKRQGFDETFDHADASSDDFGGDFADDDNGDGADNDDDDDEPQSLWRRRISIGWLIPIIVGSLVIGAVGAWGVSSVSSSLYLGDLRAADAWFSTPASAADQENLPWWLAESSGIDLQNLRPANVPGVWVGRTDTYLCLLIQQWEGSGANCVERDKFAQDGINYAVGNLSFHWYGSDVTVKESTRAGEVTVPELPNPLAGPGNIEAAKALFAVPPTAADAFPNPYVLESLGLDEIDVRRIGGTDGGMTAWALRQRATGFCLAVFKGSSTGSPNLQCATNEEFAVSGLSISALRFTARWDGETVEFTP